MGGGRQMLVSNVTGTVEDPLDTWAGHSSDGRNLIEDWKQLKARQGVSHAVVQNNGQLGKLDTENLDYVLGIFANGHLMYDHERNHSDAGMPSLTNMTLKALEVLGNSDKGYLLVVEAGMIDQAHHRGTARKALNEVVALDEAVQAVQAHLKARYVQKSLICSVHCAHYLLLQRSAGRDVADCHR